MPNDGKRDIPDVSLFASNGFNGNFYIICSKNVTGSYCDPNDPNDTIVGIGGTSASTPAFAGIMAMIDQKTNSRQGNANYTLYRLFAQQPATGCNSSTPPLSTCVFNDVTSGTIAMPCLTGSTPDCQTSVKSHQFSVLTGYPTTTGYDLAVGLGTVNAANLVNAWTTTVAGSKGSTTTLSMTPTPLTITHGATANLNVTVAPAPGGTGTPSGEIAVETSTGIGVGSFLLANGAVTGTINNLPGGSYTISAHYPGDATFTGSDSTPPISVVVSPEPSKTNLHVVTFDPNTGNVINSNATTFPYGSPYILRADVTNSSATNCFNSGTGTAAYGCPSGTVLLKDNGSPLGSGTFALNSEGYTELQTIQLSGGSHNLTGAYGGDNSYTSNSTTDAVTVVPVSTTTTILSPVSSIPPQKVVVGQPFTMSVQTTANSFGIAPIGTFTFFDGSTQLTGTISTNGFTVPSSDQVFLNGSIQAVVSAPGGPHTLTAHYSGDTNYASSVSSASTVFALYPTVTAITATPNNIVFGTSVTVTVTITTGNAASNAALKPTGTILFNSADNSITGSVTPSVSQDANGNWIAQASVTTIPQQTVSVTANYSGDSIYAPSTQSVMIIVTVPDFSISAPAAPLVITAGQSGTQTITVTPLSGLTSTVALNCAGKFQVPIPGSTCTISPSSVTLSNGNSATATMTLSILPPSSVTTADTVPAVVRRGSPGPFDPKVWGAFSVFTGLAALVLLALPERRRFLQAAFCLALVSFLTLTVSCGGGASGGGAGGGGGGGTGGGGGGGGPAASTTALSTSTTKVGQGASATLTATVNSAQLVTGSVTFNDATYPPVIAPLVNVLNGVAQAQLSAVGSVSPGTHIISAQFNGSATTLSSQSGSLNIVLTGDAQEEVAAQTGTLSHLMEVNVAIQ